MPYLSLEVGELETNAYLFFDDADRRCLVIDPGAEAEKILALIAGEKLLPQAVVLTHGHADHVGAVAAAQRPLSASPSGCTRPTTSCCARRAGADLAALFGVEPLPAAGRLLADGDIACRRTAWS